MGAHRVIGGKFARSYKPAGRWLPGVLLCLGFLCDLRADDTPPGRASAAPAVYQPVTVYTEREGAGHRIVASNRGIAPVSVMASIKHAENVHSDTSWPVFAVVPPHGELTLGRSRPAVAGAKYTFQVQSKALPGDLDAQPDSGALYRLPFLDGKTFRISQAAGGKIVTHNEPGSAYAVDFPMPVGTPVVAARDGVVVKAEGSNSEGGQTPDMLRKANSIRIQHGDGTLATYGHLAANGVFVAPGQRVVAGATIGLSGNTGYSSSPHLHFAVSQLRRTPEGLGTVSIPFRFYAGDPPAAFSPQQGMAATARYGVPAPAPNSTAGNR
ncbi:MAG: M23 family metallopeptidase [Betaproteobacteria bacterium]|nr:M23 family metallopeptidase [Betaproteobacteria bacterium]